jgi:hypothetical protein
MVGKYAANLNTLEPVMEAVKLAPMDESFKSDPSLLVTECVIRSIEARMPVSGKASLQEQDRALQDSMAQGFVLTRYFYERLLEFEKDNVGFRNALPAMLTQIDVRKEQKQASQIQFASAAGRNCCSWHARGKASCWQVLKNVSRREMLRMQRSWRNRRWRRKPKTLGGPCLSLRRVRCTET